MAQVHLANLYGEDKVSFDDRVAFVEQHMDKVSRGRVWQTSLPSLPPRFGFCSRAGWLAGCMRRRTPGERVISCPTKLLLLYGICSRSIISCVKLVFAPVSGGPLQVRDSAFRPLDGDCWWKEADSPWQCLAVCVDLVAALDSPDPSKYLSCLPVHQDGERLRNEPDVDIQFLRWSGGRHGERRGRFNHQR